MKNRLCESERIRLKEIQCFVLDMDGTFYLGEHLIEGSLDFIEVLREQGKQFLFLTNNSSRNAGYYVKKLERMGCFVETKDVYTSGQATVQYLNRFHKGSRVFLLGNDYLAKEFEEGRIQLVETDPEVVVVGFDTTLNYLKMATVCDFIRKDVLYIATHPDINCPTETGCMPDCGAIMSFIKASTNRDADAIIGKPHQYIVSGMLERIGYKKEAMAIVGDRLYTDIATGVNHGIFSILVLSGETVRADLQRSSVQPDMIFADLKSLGDCLKDC